MSDLGTVINPFQLPYVEFSEKTQLPEKSGLYFVIDGDQILYVGKTIHFKRRWAGHHRYAQIKAMAKNPVIAWLDVEDTRLLDAESELIARFKPKLNWTRVSQDNSKSKPKAPYSQKRASQNNGNSTSGMPLKIKFDWTNVRDKFEESLFKQLDELETKAAGVRELFARIDQLDTASDTELRDLLKQVEVGINNIKQADWGNNYGYPSGFLAMYDSALLNHLRSNGYFT